MNMVGEESMFLSEEELKRNLNAQVIALQECVGASEITFDEEKRIECDFLIVFVYRPVEMALRQMALGKEVALTIEVFLFVHNIITDIFPYWIDNNYLFKKGKRVVEFISLLYEPIQRQDDLTKRLKELCVVYEKIMPVSVVMTTYNRIEYIEKAVQSVLAQTYDHLELVIVDDGSEIDVEGCVGNIRDKRIKYIRIDENHGVAHARNVGIRASKYEWIAFCDDDDVYRPEKLEKQVLALAEADTEGFCYCEMCYHRLDGETLLFVPRRDIDDVRKSGYIYPELLRRNYVGGPTILVPKHCLNEIGGFDEELSVLEDWDMALRLAKAYPAIFVSEPLYDYFERENSLTTTRTEGHVDRATRSVERLEAKIQSDRVRYGLNEYHGKQ